MLPPVPLARLRGDQPPLALGTWRALRELERSAAEPWERVRERQLARLRAVVDHAQRTVPLYERRYERCRGDRLLDHTDLLALPTIDRATAVDVPLVERRARGSTAAATHTSSGSSGHLVVTEVDRWGSWWRGLLWMRRRRSQGLQPWSRQVTFRAPSEGEDRFSLLWRLTGQRISSLDPNLSPDAIVRELARRRPHVLVGNPHVVVEAGQRGLRLARPPAVVTGGMVLTPEDRGAIRDLYGHDPFDVYGLVEVGPIAGQCRAADLYHVDHESVVVEVLDDDGRPVPPGTSGDLVVTSLWNLHMPFVRYRTGDRVTLADRPCRCGYAQPAIATIDGRIADWFADGRGGRVAPQRLFISGRVGDEYQPWVERYRVRQASDGAVTVDLVPRQPIPEAFLRRVEQAYAAMFAPQLPVRASVVDAIPLDRSGKFRQFSSECPTEPSTSGERR